MKPPLLLHRLRIRLITAPLLWLKGCWCGLFHRPTHRRYVLGALHIQQCTKCGAVSDIKEPPVVHTCPGPKTGICMCAINQILARTRGR